MDQDDLTDETVPWLREMVDDELLGLFGDEKAEVARCARNLATRAVSDSSVLDLLIEALRASIIHRNDETQASIWIALILGEIGDPSSLPVLILGLGGEDESIQEAARDAILMIGPAGIEALMEEMEEEEPGPELIEAGYRLLGMAGNFNDPVLRERVMDFLADRVELEVAKPPGECRIESLFHASSLLGDRRMLQVMDRILRERFGGRNTAIQDYREMLSENTGGDPLIYDGPPWIVESRWLFEEDLESSRVRGRRGFPGEGEESKEKDEENLSNLYWGLGSTVERGSEDTLDARRFIDHPEEEAGDEE